MKRRELIRAGLATGSVMAIRSEHAAFAVSKRIASRKRRKGMWKGVHTGLDGRSLPALQRSIVEDLAPMGVNTLVIEVNYNFDYRSHRELKSGSPITKSEARSFARACREKGVRVIPQFQCLGHQSWSKTTMELLTRYPEFDETPQIPKDNPDIYCRSWCPQHPKVNEVVFALMDELIDAFEADALHVGMDEVFLIANEGCPRCRGKDPAALFALAVNDYHRHLAGKRKVEVMMWGDRLIDSKEFPYGTWEASANGTAPAIDRIPKDIVICDWHYEIRKDYPSVAHFQKKGFRVWPAGWKTVEAVEALIDESLKNRTEKMVGYLATVWGAAQPDALGDWPPLKAAMNRLAGEK